VWHRHHRVDRACADRVSGVIDLLTGVGVPPNVT